MCGSFCSAFESTSHMLRNMVISKLKYLTGPASGTTLHPLGRSRVYFLLRHTGVEWSDSIVGEGVPDPRTRKKGEK